MAVISKLVAELNLDDKGFSSGLDHASGKASAFGGKLGKILGVAAVAAGAAVITKSLYGIGSTFDTLDDTITTKTGATGKAFTDLENITKDVFGAIPTSMETAVNAVTDLSQKTGDTGKVLDALSKSEIELARITGTDLAGNIDKSAKIFNAFGVAAEDQVATLDDFFNVSQKTGVGVDQLMSQVQQFNPTLRQFGLTANQSALLIGKLDKAGLNVTGIMQGLKHAVVPLTKDFGTDLHGGLTKVFDDITKLGPGAASTAEAVKYFGAKAGPELAQAILAGTISVDDLNAILGDTGDTILDTAAKTNDAAESWKLFKNNLVLLLEPLGEFVFNGLNLAIPLLTDAVKWIGRFADALGNAFSSGKQVSTLVKEFPGPIQSLIGMFLTLADSAGDVVRAFNKDGLSGAFDALGPAIKQAIGAIADIVIDVPIKVGKWLIGKIPDVWDWLKGVLGVGTSVTGDGTGGPDSDRSVSLGDVLVNAALAAGGDILKWAGNVWGWVKEQLGVGTSVTGDGTGGPDSDQTFSLGDVTIGAALSWAKSVDWAGLVIAAGTAIANAVTAAADFLSPVTSAITDKLSSIEWGTQTFNFSGAGAKVGDAIHSAIVGAADIGTKAVSAVADAVQNADWSSIPGKIADGLVTALTAVALAPAALMEAIGTFVGGAIEHAVFGKDVDFSVVVTKIGDAISNAFDKTADWGQGAIDKVVKFFTDLPGKVVDKVGALKFDLTEPTLPDWMTNFDWISGPVDTLIDTINGLVQDLQDAWAKLQFWNNPGSAPGAVDADAAAKGAVDTGKIASSLSGNINGELVTTLPGVGSGSPMFDGLMKAADDARKAVADSFVGMRDDVAQITTDLVNKITNDFVGAQTNLVTLSTDTSNQVVNQIISMRNNVVTIASDLSNQAVNQFVGLRNNAVNLATGTSNAVVNAFVGMRNSAVTLAGDFANGVANSFVGMRSSVVSIVSSTANAVLSTLSGLAGSAGSYGYAVGDALGSGIYSGMNAWIGAIASAAANLVSTAIAAARAAAGAHSPSRKMMALGDDMVMGLIIPIDAGRTRVASAMDNLIAFPSANGWTAADGWAGGGLARNADDRGTVSVTFGDIIIQGVDKDSKEIADEVMGHLSREMRLLRAG